MVLGMSMSMYLFHLFISFHWPPVSSGGTEEIRMKNRDASKINQKKRQYNKQGTTQIKYEIAKS